MTFTQAVSTEQASERPWWPAMKLGFRGRCPACGEGKIFRAFLKVNDCCPACGEELHHHRADDAPPYFTILIVGHLIVAPLLFFPWIWQANVWLVLGTVMPALLLATLAFLPVVKGAVVGLHWAMEPRHAVEEA